MSLIVCFDFLMAHIKTSFAFLKQITCFAEALFKPE